MSEVIFEYNGRTHTGQIVSSTNVEPHYHWVYFNDQDITKLINDDCIGFKKKDNQLQPTKIYTSHLELVETVKRVVEMNIYRY
jgi:hypothetical protein